MYQRLDPDRIVATARILASRVGERFPGSGLSLLAGELVQVTERAARDAAWLGKPRLRLRVGIGMLVALLLALVAGVAAALLRLRAEASLTEVLQASESLIQDVVFLGIAVYFLASLEARSKRRRALAALHTHRAMAHIVDMHQLTKDPERVVHPASGPDTPSSPARAMTGFELSRYLDYCSEMLSLLSKAAALYVQDFSDPVTISTVNEIEDLTTGLSRKIWQKIMILDRIAGPAAPGP